MTLKKPLTDLEFRGTRWYLAEDVDKKLEAIKNYIEELKKETQAGFYQTSKQSIYRKLEKILEEK